MFQIRVVHNYLSTAFTDFEMSNMFEIYYRNKM